MQVFVTVVDGAEASAALAAGVRLVDVKAPADGALAAAGPDILREVVAAAKRDGAQVSAALGDLGSEPGTAALAAWAAATLGADYVKAGLFAAEQVEDAERILRAVVGAVHDANAATRVIAASYADFRRFRGLSPKSLVEAAANAGCAGVLLDTFHKDGGSLFDLMREGELVAFVDGAAARGLSSALAGGLGVADMPRLAAIGPDFVGLRGAVALEGDRTRALDPLRLAELAPWFTAAPAAPAR